MKYLIYPIIICFIVFGNVSNAIADISNEIANTKEIERMKYLIYPIIICLLYLGMLAMQLQILKKMNSGIIKK